MEDSTAAAAAESFVELCHTSLIASASITVHQTPAAESVVQNSINSDTLTELEPNYIDQESHQDIAEVSLEQSWKMAINSNFGNNFVVPIHPNTPSASYVSRTCQSLSQSHPTISPILTSVSSNLIPIISFVESKLFTKYGQLNQNKKIVQVLVKLGIPPGGMAPLILVVMSLVMGKVWKYHTKFVTNFLAVIYPAWRSLNSIETFGNKEESEHWLTYWSIFGILTLSDSFVSKLKSKSVYFCLKLMLFYYTSSSEGSRTVYKAIIKPIIDKISKIIYESNQRDLISSSGYLIPGSFPNDLSIAREPSDRVYNVVGRDTINRHFSSNGAGVDAHDNTLTGAEIDCNDNVIQQVGYDFGSYSDLVNVANIAPQLSN